ncbi:hypothetical protein LTR53_019593, partial [Teratosphaeriaceae sp. CCFEE 6253]
MDEMAPLISQEQNFVVEFFHASGRGAGRDFGELVAAAPLPGERRGPGDMRAAGAVEPDREMAGAVKGTMDQLFASFASEMGALLEWAVAGDPTQGVGVMACLAKHAFYLQDTGQEFLVQLLEALAARLRAL